MRKNKKFLIVPKATVQQPKACVACNGTGRYDSNNSPKCGSCDGTCLEFPNS